MRDRGEDVPPLWLWGLDVVDPEQAQALLQVWLHDPGVAVRVEPFASILEAMLERRSLALWDLPVMAPELPLDFLQTLPQSHPECLACPCYPICEGYGAWKDSCAVWKRVITDLAAATRELRCMRQQVSTGDGCDIRGERSRLPE